MSESEIAWIAGLFEGEATFGYGGTRSGTGVRAVRITLAMTDEDVVEKAFAIIGAGSFNPEKEKFSRQFPDAKPLYVYSIGGQKDCLDLMRLLRPHMGERRRTRMDELIEHLENNPLQFIRGEGGRHGSWRKAKTGCPCEKCLVKREDIALWSQKYEKKRGR